MNARDILSKCIYSYLKLFISSTIKKKKYPQGYVLSLARNEKNSCIEDKRDQSSFWSSFNLRADKIILNFQVFMSLSVPHDIQHPKSGLFPLLAWILGMNAFRKHVTFFIFPMTSWDFIRTEQRPIECKFLASGKIENHTSERKEKEKNRRKKL